MSIFETLAKRPSSIRTEKPRSGDPPLPSITLTLRIKIALAATIIPLARGNSDCSFPSIDQENAASHEERQVACTKQHDSSYIIGRGYPPKWSAAADLVDDAIQPHF